MVKLAVEELLKILEALKPTDPAVIVGPEVGEDAAIIDLGDELALVTHPDPISGALEFLGYLAVHVPANDVAVTGARPKYFMPVILVPEGAPLDTVSKVVNDVKEALQEIGGHVVGGHTEVTDAVTHPLVITTAMGLARKESIVRTSGAKPGDAVIMTKTAGIEGTAVLASDFRDELLRRGVPYTVVKEGEAMIRQVSVVKEALILAKHGLANSMHDPTEGGVIGGLTEIAYASNTSIIIDEAKIPLNPVTKSLASAMRVDPLKMLSSGALLATVPEDKANDALKVIREEAGVDATVIGKVVERSDYLLRLIHADGSVEDFRSPHVTDEIMKLWLETR